MICHPCRGRIVRNACAGCAIWAVLSYSAFAVEDGTAQYEVVFDAVWSTETHPDQFPSSPHFSGLIGGTHNTSVSFWTPGQLATDGIESMAETGSKSTLQGEVEAAIRDGTAEFVISGPGIGRSPGMAQVTFDVSESFPLLTLVSMIAPSPDWFVGVSDLDLRPGDQWLDKAVVDLFAYDAGTDSGPSYQSPNDDTDPAEPIRHINEFPLQDHAPLGTYTILRLIPGDFNRSGNYDVADIDFVSEQLRNGSTDPSLDLNQDGSVTAQDRDYWVTNLAQTSFGDSNLDGAFDSSDLVAVFQAGQFDNGVAGDSVWATGDWDGNGDFDSGDLVLAFQTGAYESSSAAAVPEPHTGWLAGAAIVGLLTRIRRRRCQPRRAI